ncbi:MAG: urea transport system ATP-binding protein [Zhongshania sp.]|jgi:urea transport system ATP-binding protein
MAKEFILLRSHLLVLDEPRKVFSPLVLKLVSALLPFLRQQGEMTVVSVEQYFDFVQVLANNYAVMNRG